MHLCQLLQQCIEGLAASKIARIVVPVRRSHRSGWISVQSMSQKGAFLEATSSGISASLANRQPTCDTARRWDRW